MNLFNFLIRKTQPTRYIPPRVKIVPFDKLKLGRPINSGYQATVYNLKGFNSLVVKTNIFEPSTLRWEVDDFTHVLMDNNSGTKILERMPGEPLYGKNWRSLKSPSVYRYKKQLKQLIDMPDEAYLDFISQLNLLREKGYAFDNVNPNNILLDKKKNKFNIVDVGYDSILKRGKTVLSLADFYPFWDKEHLYSIYKKANSYNRNQIMTLVKTFIDKIKNVGAKNGYCIKIESLDKYKLQDAHVYLYNGLRKKMDSIVNKYKT